MTEPVVTTRQIVEVLRAEYPAHGRWKRGNRPGRQACDRLWEKVSVVGRGCHEWLASKGHLGYGQIWYEGALVSAHRVAYEIDRGPIPKGMELDHLCKNPGCVNPWHLELVTQYQNNLRSNSPAALNARKTHCPRGHPYTPENTELRKHGRRCRICHRAEVREYKRRKRAERKLLRGRVSGV